MQNHAVKEHNRFNIICFYYILNIIFILYFFSYYSSYFAQKLSTEISNSIDYFLI